MRGGHEHPVTAVTVRRAGTQRTATVSAQPGAACTSTAIAAGCSSASGMKNSGVGGEKKETLTKNLDEKCPPSTFAQKTN